MPHMIHEVFDKIVLDQ